jgi:hypothetical protein
MKQWQIAHILAATLILASSAWGGIRTNKDTTFGTQDDTVTVTVHGKLDLSGGQVLAITPNTSIAMKQLYSWEKGVNRFEGGIVYGVSITSNTIELDLDELKKDWHFFVATVDTEGVTINGRTPEGNGTDTHTTSIMLPTALIQSGERYEMAKHMKRECMFLWFTQHPGVPTRLLKFEFDHVMALKIKLYGMLKKN